MNDRPEPGGPDPTPDALEPDALEPDALELDGLGLDADALDAELEADDGALQVSLRALLAPPSDIEDRVADTVSQRLIARSAAGTALDLLGLGARTLMTILTEPGPAADRSGNELAREGDGPAEGRIAT